MILLDVNVLLALHRDDHPNHETTFQWFAEIQKVQTLFTVPPSIWASFVRIATNSRIFQEPTTLREAFKFIDALRGQTNIRQINPDEHHLEIFKELCIQMDCAGDLAPDAYLASIAMGFACKLASFDRDFARFQDLDWIIPQTL